MSIGVGILVFFVSMVAVVAEFLVYMGFGLAAGASTGLAGTFVFLMFLTLFIGIYYPICTMIAAASKDPKRGQKAFAIGVQIFIGLLLLLMVLGRHHSKTSLSAALNANPPLLKNTDPNRPLRISPINILYYLDRTARGMGELPKEGYLYQLTYVQPMQKLNDGYLIQSAHLFPSDSGSTEVVYLYTDKQFADGQFLDGYWAEYVGQYEYQALTGFQKSIPAFRLVDRETALATIDREPNFVSSEGRVVPNPLKRLKEKLAV